MTAASPMSLGSLAKGGNYAIKPPASKQPCLHLHRAALAVVKFSKHRLLNVMQVLGQQQEIYL